MSADAPQIGYAVHFYPGWYNTSDTKTDTIASIRSFLGSVPVVKTSPVMITEVDWSPEDPDGTPHQNEVGEWVKPNCGTWATGSTSKFGMGFKAIIDYFGNLGWTLTHTHDYIDIDQYLQTGKLVPAFSSKLTDNAYEACSGACFKWYPQYAKSVHQARAWNDGVGPVEGIDSLIFDSSSDDVEIFQLNGQRATGSQRGFFIIRKGDGTVKKVFTCSSVRPGL